MQAIICRLTDMVMAMKGGASNKCRLTDVLCCNLMCAASAIVWYQGPLCGAFRSVCVCVCVCVV